MSTEDGAIERRIRSTVDAAVVRLVASGARDEALAEMVEPRKVLLVFTREARLVPVGRAWRLGTILLDRAGTLYATGTITRAVEPGWPGHVSVSAEVRRDHRAAASRGPFEPGESVNFGWSVIDVDVGALRASRGPLFVDGDVPRVRWSSSLGDASAIELGAYLDDRVGLLVDPPRGA